ncbi:MAG: 60S ribosomal export protein NMD3 [Methanomassiliicoccus sp.]|nr:60S ribosomal export protein NMD3 [Methanomassiliicoccus sp.]
MFCVKCGKEGKTYSALCPECFLQSNHFTSVPEYIDLNVCAHCEDYLMGKKWKHYDDELEAVKDFAADNVMLRHDARMSDLEIGTERMDAKHYRVRMVAHLVHEDLEVVEEMETTVRVRRNVCPKCNKIQGNYFESIVQVRPSGKRFSDEEREAVLNRSLSYVEGVAKESRDAFIAKVTQAHGGYDLYVSTVHLGKALARDLVSTYGAEYKESSSLQGQKDGHDIYRVTYLVRLPPYRVRDILLINHRLYLVHSTGPQSAKLRDLKSNEMLVGMNSELREVNVVGTKKDVVDVVVLTETDREFQIMHPTTYKSVEIKKPRNFERTGETIKVFPYEGELYFIGN